MQIWIRNSPRSRKRVLIIITFWNDSVFGNSRIRQNCLESKFTSAIYSALKSTIAIYSAYIYTLEVLHSLHEYVIILVTFMDFAELFLATPLPFSLSVLLPDFPLPVWFGLLTISIFTSAAQNSVLDANALALTRHRSNRIRNIHRTHINYESIHFD